MLRPCAKHFWRMTPYADRYVYIGFFWIIPDRTVQLPEAKKKKYLARLEPWQKGATISMKECEKVVGTLNHVCLAVPEGRSRLPSFYRFTAALTHTPNRFVRKSIPAVVLEDVQWWREQLEKEFCGVRMGILTIGESGWEAGGKRAEETSIPAPTSQAQPQVEHNKE